MGQYPDLAEHEQRTDDAAREKSAPEYRCECSSRLCRPIPGTEAPTPSEPFACSPHCCATVVARGRYLSRCSSSQNDETPPPCRARGFRSSSNSERDNSRDGPCQGLASQLVERKPITLPGEEPRHERAHLPVSATGSLCRETCDTVKRKRMIAIQQPSGVKIAGHVLYRVLSHSRRQSRPAGTLAFVP